MEVTIPQRTPGMPDEAILRRAGQKVRERLARVPEAYRLPTEEAEIWALGDFLTAQECSRLIAMIDAVAKPSAAYDVPYETGYRTSYSGDLASADSLIRRVERRMNDLLGIDPACSETVQGQRYLPGQEFQPHTDWFPAESPYWMTERNRGGQRSITAMAYLNDVAEGGATSFTQLGLTVEPKPGVLLIWNNADRDGLPNPMTLHAGLPVTKGAKYVLTKWYRARPWR
jgi:prolyl 4-hydroxylase